MRLSSSTVVRAVVAAASFVTAACGSGQRVVRVYDGRLVEGRYVSPDAYASLLRGVLAEESGDLRGALAAYVQALDEDEDDPEIATRIGEVRCKINPKDPEIDHAFARALKLDASSASALAAKSRCALARGKTDEAADLARRAASQDPKNVALAAFAVRTEANVAAAPDPAARERAIALTTAHGDDAAAWDALIAWGYSRKDAGLVARGLEGLVRAAPARSLEVEKGAVALAAGGQPALARKVAIAISDAPRELGVIGPRDATVARLAVDEALARGDGATALARATRGHVPLTEVAARALVLDRRDVAAAVAASIASADPRASGALMVQEALKSAAPGPTSSAGKPVPAAAGVATALVTDQPPEICALVFADRLAATSGTAVARGWLARVTRTPMTPNDPLAGPLAVDLASRGVLPVADLPLELRAVVQRVRASD
jgi:hypothetical protein